MFVVFVLLQIIAVAIKKWVNYLLSIIAPTLRHTKCLFFFFLNFFLSFLFVTQERVIEEYSMDIGLDTLFLTGTSSGVTFKVCNLDFPAS